MHARGRAGCGWGKSVLRLCASNAFIRSVQQEEDEDRAERWENDDEEEAEEEGLEQTNGLADAVGVSFSLVPGLVRVLPSTCITFVVYENARRYLR